MELIVWWFFNGKILNNDLPLELPLPLGIFHAFILKAKPSEEKNITGVCVCAVNICTTKSSSRVTILDFPIPPLFCCFKLASGLLFI